MQKKTAEQTIAVNTEIVLPNDTNTLGNLMGGKLLHWMDMIAAISSHRLCKRVCVTASVNNVAFKQPIKLGDIVTLEAKVSRTFNSSMEIFIDVYVEDRSTSELNKVNEAIYTFVAVDQMGNTIQVPQVVPETKQEKERYDGALRRRQLSLILAGKMKPSEATELKALFAEG
ncbi:MAG: acyl-CoA thioesterase [Flavobacteriales bacterium]|nr:acyl-CoA thioesterase [Flavobacteriales bacterium]